MFNTFSTQLNVQIEANATAISQTIEDIQHYEQKLREARERQQQLEREAEELQQQRQALEVADPRGEAILSQIEDYLAALQETFPQLVDEFASRVKDALKVDTVDMSGIDPEELQSESQDVPVEVQAVTEQCTGEDFEAVDAVSEISTSNLDNSLTEVGFSSSGTLAIVDVTDARLTENDLKRNRFTRPKLNGLATYIGIPEAESYPNIPALITEMVTQGITQQHIDDYHNL